MSLTGEWRLAPAFPGQLSLAVRRLAVRRLAAVFPGQLSSQRLAPAFPGQPW